VVESQILNRF